MRRENKERVEKVREEGEERLRERKDEEKGEEKVREEDNVEMWQHWHCLGTH